MEAILDFTEFARKWSCVEDLFDYNVQDVVQYGMIIQDVEMIVYSLDSQYIIHCDLYHTIAELKSLLPKPDLIYLSYQDIAEVTEHFTLN